MQSLLQCVDMLIHEELSPLDANHPTTKTHRRFNFFMGAQRDGVFDQSPRVS